MREYALLGMLAFLWGASYPLIKVSVETIPPLTLVSIRVCIAVLLLLAIAAAKQQRLPSSPASWYGFTCQSCLNCIVPWSLLVWGQQYVDSSIAAILNSTTPVFVLLMTGLWFRHEPVTRLKGLGAVTGLAGTVLIIGVEALSGLGEQVLAQLAIMGATVAYAGAAIYGKTLTRESSLITACGTLCVAAVVMVPAALLIERPWTIDPSAASLAAAVVLGFFSTGLALIIYFRLLKTLGSSGTTSVSYLRTVVAVLLGVLVLGEQLPLSAILGIVLVLAGVIMLTRQSGVPRTLKRPVT